MAATRRTDVLMEKGFATLAPHREIHVVNTNQTHGIVPDSAELAALRARIVTYNSDPNSGKTRAISAANIRAIPRNPRVAEWMRSGTTFDLLLAIRSTRGAVQSQGLSAVSPCAVVWEYRDVDADMYLPAHDKGAYRNQAAEHVSYYQLLCHLLCSEELSNVLENHGDVIAGSGAMLELVLLTQAVRKDRISGDTKGWQDRFVSGVSRGELVYGGMDVMLLTAQCSRAFDLLLIGQFISPLCVTDGWPSLDEMAVGMIHGCNTPWSATQRSTLEAARKGNPVIPAPGGNSAQLVTLVRSVTGQEDFIPRHQNDDLNMERVWSASLRGEKPAEVDRIEQPVHKGYAKHPPVPAIDPHLPPCNFYKAIPGVEPRNNFSCKHMRTCSRAHEEGGIIVNQQQGDPVWSDWEMGKYRNHNGTGRGRGRGRGRSRGRGYNRGRGSDRGQHGKQCTRPDCKYHNCPGETNHCYKCGKAGHKSFQCYANQTGSRKRAKFSVDDVEINLSGDDYAAFRKWQVARGKFLLRCVYVNHNSGNNNHHGINTCVCLLAPPTRRRRKSKPTSGKCVLRRVHRDNDGYRPSRNRSLG